MANITNNGALPDWLEGIVTSNDKQSERKEIEAKFVLKKKDAIPLIEHPDAIKYDIEQFYLPAKIVKSYLPNKYLPHDSVETYSEWRIRKKNDSYLFTCKRNNENTIGIRDEYEVTIDKETYDLFISHVRNEIKPEFVKKTRYTHIIEISDEKIAVEVDVYYETGAGKVDLNYVTCEIEVPTEEILGSIRSRASLHPSLAFLGLGFDATEVKQLSNKFLAKNSFIKSDYLELKNWIKETRISKVVDLMNIQEKEYSLKTKEEILANIEYIEKLVSSNDKNREQLNASIYLRAQGVLKPLRFSIFNSLGRLRKDSNQSVLDTYGNGWLRDFHVIVSNDSYLRLSSKPQIFRPGIGHQNTTTRGAHTLDVISCSAQIAQQLGLNIELCMAIAALHDIGHPAGGHIGEEIIYELSNKKFKHHIFSLSLSELFSMNLLKEVQVGAFYHKTGGGKLQTPRNKPEEYGVVRVADKVSYVPWDFFDSIRNGFITENHETQLIMKVLGKTPLEWINKLIKAIVVESASMYKVSFTEYSKDIFFAFKEARNIIYNHVHKEIKWDLLRSEYTLVFESIKKSFPDIDPVPIIAYMTDNELIRIAQLSESRAKNHKLSYNDYLSQGFGFLDIVDLLKDGNFNEQNLYYTHINKI